MSFWKNVEKGDLLGAARNLIGALTGHLPGPLSSLVSRLMSDEGQVAYEIAQHAWEQWTDEHLDLLTVAKNAAAEGLTKGLTVAEQDVADWLGIIDRSTPASLPPAAS